MLNVKKKMLVNVCEGLCLMVYVLEGVCFK